MIFAWLASKGLLGLTRWVWVVAVIAALVGGWLWLSAAEDKDDTRNQEIGATVEREKATHEVLQRTEQGNAIREEIQQQIRRGDGRALYDECMLTSRTTANCKRFLSE